MQEAYFGLPRVQSACLFRIELKAKGIFHLAKRFSVAKMSPLCDCGGEHVQKLNQQVYVMRKEIKNLRQMLDNAIRAHRKHVTSLQSAVTKLGVCDHDKDETPPPASPASLLASFEKGNIQTVPIGYISSCFSEKNGTPRQPTICGPSRAELRIRLSVFNNPEHALVGLEHFSHVWIIFLFHKNGHPSYKAKVKPPRLNGERVGLYSTRSPHRPNALGLTLAKLDKIEGDTIHLSDIDMIAGTPVLDIKPYIPKYDSPHTRGGMDSEPFDPNTDKKKASTVAEKVDISDFQKDRETETQSDLESKRTNTQYLGSCLSREEVDIPDTGSSEISAPFSIPKHIQSVLQNVKTYVTQADICLVNCESESQVLDPNKTKPLESTMHYPCFGTETYSTIADWIKQPPVGNLVVRFTPHAEKELAKFLPSNQSGSSQQDGPRFKFLRSPEEAAAAIRGVLSADPRSVYRRTRCRDRLFFFTLDTADITCWFGEGFAEVVQVRAIEENNASKRQTFSVNAS